MEIRTSVEVTGIASVEFNINGTWHTLAVCPNARAAEVVVDCVKNQLTQEAEEQLAQIVENSE